MFHFLILDQTISSHISYALTWPVILTLHNKLRGLLRHLFLGNQASHRPAHPIQLAIISLVALFIESLVWLDYRCTFLGRVSSGSRVRLQRLLLRIYGAGLAIFEGW